MPRPQKSIYVRYSEAQLIQKTHSHVTNILASIYELEKMIAIGHLPMGEDEIANKIADARDRLGAIMTNG